MVDLQGYAAWNFLSSWLRGTTEDKAEEREKVNKGIYR